MQEGQGGFAGGIDVRGMTLDAKIRTGRTDISTISNGATAGLTQYFDMMYSPDRPTILRKVRAVITTTISNHDAGTLKIGTAADDDAVIVAAADMFDTLLQNLPAGTVVDLTSLFATTLKAVPPLHEYHGGLLIPKATLLIAVWSGMAASGTGAARLCFDFFPVDVDGE